MLHRNRPENLGQLAVLTLLPEVVCSSHDRQRLEESVACLIILGSGRATEGFLSLLSGPCVVLSPVGATLQGIFVDKVWGKSTQGCSAAWGGASFGPPVVLLPLLLSLSLHALHTVTS